MTTPANQSPRLTNNTGIPVAPNAWVTITSEMLQITDADTPPDQLTYTITHLPTGGRLHLNGQALSVNSSFTQADINQGRLTYFHEGNSTVDLGFVFSDGQQEMTYLTRNTWGNSISFSASSRYITFLSDDRSLVSNDTNGLLDVYVFDRYTGTYSRASVSSSGVQSNHISGGPSVSADGRFVAFLSHANNLVAGDTNQVEDSFLHDRLTGETIRISVDPNGNQSIGGRSWGTTMSADGRFIAISSAATNLALGEDINNDLDVFVYDRLNRHTTRVSVPFNGIADSFGFSRWPRISDDGRYLSFFSRARNLVPDDTNDLQDIFVHDLHTGQTRRVSVASDGTQNTTVSSTQMISGDGRYVVFNSHDGPLVQGDTNRVMDVFIHDRVTGETSRVSTGAQGQQANGGSRNATVSSDGRYVAFASAATNLLDGNVAPQGQIYIRDRHTGQTTVVPRSFLQNPAQSTLSWSQSYTEYDTESFESEISPDGRAIVFFSSYGDVLGEGANQPAGLYLYAPRLFTGRTTLGGEIRNTAPRLQRHIPDGLVLTNQFFKFTLPADTFVDPDAADILTYTVSRQDGSSLPKWLKFDPQTHTFSGTPSIADAGLLNLRVTASDGVGGRADGTIVVDVVDNAAPILTKPLGDRLHLTGNPFSLMVSESFVDPDPNDVLTYSATLLYGGSLPTWLTLDPITGRLSGTPTRFEHLDISVRATDRFGAFRGSRLRLGITDFNYAPIVSTPLIDQSVREDDLLTIDIPSNTFQDFTSFDALTLSATLEDGRPLPSWLTFLSTERRFTGTPTNADVGRLNVMVTATDRLGMSASDVFALTVFNTNDAPALVHPIAHQTAIEGTSFSFTVPNTTFLDVDAGDLLTYRATLSTGTPLPRWLLFDSTNRRFSGTPANADVGRISLRVTATDRAGASTSNVFDLTIANTNDPPVLVTPLPAQEGVRQSIFSYTVPESSFSDVDLGDSLTYSATLANGSPLPGWLTFDAETRTLSGTPANIGLGTINLRITATDAAGASASSVFDLRIIDINRAPTLLNPIVDQAGIQGNEISFTLPRNTFQDSDTDEVLTYSAIQADGRALPVWLTFDPSTLRFGGTPTNADVGVLQIRVTARDRVQATESDVFALTIANTNDAPILVNSIPNLAGLRHYLFSYTVPTNTFLDIDVGDSLTYRASMADGSPLPAWLTFNPSTRTLSGTTSSASQSSLNLRITASDRAGASVSSSFELKVVDVNLAPTLVTPIADQSGVQGSEFRFTIPGNTFQDPDADDVLSYSAIQANGWSLPSWLSFDSRTLTFRGTPPNDAVGILRLMVTARDPIGATATDVFEVAIANINDTPILATPLAHQFATGNQPFTYTIPETAFRDADLDDSLTYSAALDDGRPLPAWLSFDRTTRTFSGSPTNADAGRWVVRVTATDRSGASVGGQFEVAIVSSNRPPVWTQLIPSQLADRNQPFTFTIPDIVQDSDAGDAITLAATVQNGSPLPNWLRFDSATRTFSGTPNWQQVGTEMIRVTATDRTGASVGTTFALIIRANNTAPTLSMPIADQVGRVGSPFRLTLPKTTFHNADVDEPLTYSATQWNMLPLPAWLTFDPSTLTFSGTPTAVSRYELRVTAIDPFSNIDSDHFELTIFPEVHLPPPVPPPVETVGTPVIPPPPPRPPITGLKAVDDHLRMQHNQLLVLRESTLLQNDINSGGALTIIGFTELPHGVLFKSSSDAYTYLPYYSGTSHFQYTVRNAQGQTSTAWINITIPSLPSVLRARPQDDRLVGNNRANVMHGRRSRTTLLGGGGDDVLYGKYDADILDGGTGNDLLMGSGGSDILLGGDGNDHLVGDGGRDRLTGGRGRDFFHINSTTWGAGDQITDFRVGEDTLLISRKGFPEFDHPLGQLSSSQFKVGSRATQASDRFIYDRRSGTLFFDQDGVGGTAQVPIVQLLNRPNLTAASLSVML